MVTQQGGLQQLDEELCQARRKLEAKLPPKHPASGQGAPVGSSIVISDFLDPRVIKRCLGAAWDLCDSHKERSAVLAKWCLDQRLWQERANANKKPKENPKKNPVQAELTDPDFILALPIDDLKELLRPLVTFLKGWKLRKKEKGDPRANGKATRLNTYRTMVEPAREAHFSAISKWRMVIFKEEDDAPPFPVSLDGKLFMDAAVLNSVDIKEMAAFLDDVEASKEFSIDKLPFVSPSGLGSQDPPLQVQLSGGSAAQRPDQSDCYCQTTLSKAFCSCSTAVKLGHMPMLQSREFFKSAADSTASTSQEPAASPETVQIGECIDELLAIKHDLAAEPPNKRAKPSDDLDSIQPANLMTQGMLAVRCGLQVSCSNLWLYLI